MPERTPTFQKGLQTFIGGLEDDSAFATATNLQKQTDHGTDGDDDLNNHHNLLKRGKF